MFLFAKKNINMDAVDLFWVWFLENEQWIIDNFDDRGLEIVKEMSSRLKPIFPDFKGQIEFDFTFFKGAGEFNFYHNNKNYLLNGSKILIDKMPIEISQRWTFSVSR